jgi:GTP cyclohydrolase I
MSKGMMVGELDAEKLAEENIEDLVKLTVKWTGFEINGEELPATPENFRMVYTDWPWIREQAQDFVGNRANFFR